MPKMAVSELKALLEAEKKDALAGFNATKLAEERQRGLDYYLGDMDDDMPTLPDRSKAVSSDVADTVEGLLPALIEIFTAGERPVTFEPVGIEDEEAAQQETEYVNHVFMQENRGFLILYSFIKDALLSKNGIVKVFWEEKEEEDRHSYRNLSLDALSMLMADEEIEIVDIQPSEDSAYGAD